MITNIDEIIRIFSQGEMIILVDDEDRENEGDLVVSSKNLTSEHINFMITFGIGFVCAPI
jgi:3,4-dihydroxy 2-butanone 4-phosphate synthase/GTP cyclohydrolase II